eukprot:GEMP01056861.1.p1 GENE.GEMP01056861.1~~GEMP01056861.1.p1  ORF type:complete len:137 (+),score=22.78 GEMP01056861.1:42-413(+)
MVVIDPPGGSFSATDGVGVRIIPEKSEHVVHWRFKWIREGKRDGPSFEGRYPPGEDGHAFEAGYELTKEAMGYRSRADGEPLLQLAVPGTIQLLVWTSDEGETAFTEPEYFIEALYELDNFDP